MRGHTNYQSLQAKNNSKALCDMNLKDSAEDAS